MPAVFPYTEGADTALGVLSECSDKMPYPTDLIIRIFPWEVRHSAAIQKKDADNYLGMNYNYVTKYKRR